MESFERESVSSNLLIQWQGALKQIKLLNGDVAKVKKHCTKRIYKS